MDNQKLSYKEKQRLYETINKERGKMVWVSKEKGDIKGRTYVKKEEELKELFKKKDEEENNG